MNAVQFFTSVIGMIWREMGKIIVPVINIPVTSFLLGVFIVGVAIGILQPLLGIGGGIYDASTSSFQSAVRYGRHNASVRRAREARAADRAVKDVNRWV